MISLVDGYLDVNFDLLLKAFDTLTYRVQSNEKKVSNGKSLTQRQVILEQQGVDMLKIAYPDTKLPSLLEEFY